MGDRNVPLSSATGAPRDSEAPGDTPASPDCATAILGAKHAFCCRHALPDGSTRFGEPCLMLSSDTILAQIRFADGLTVVVGRGLVRQVIPQKGIGA